MRTARRRRASSRCNFRRVTWSTAENGSSRSNTAGSRASARARHGYTLLLSARERSRSPIIEPLKADKREQLARAAGPLVARYMAECRSDVALRCEVRE